MSWLLTEGQFIVSHRSHGYKTEGQYIVSHRSHGNLRKFSTLCPIYVMVTYGRSVHCVQYKSWLLTEGQYIVSHRSHGYKTEGQYIVSHRSHGN